MDGSLITALQKTVSDGFLNDRFWALSISIPFQPKKRDGSDG